MTGLLIPYTALVFVAGYSLALYTTGYWRKKKPWCKPHCNGHVMTGDGRKVLMFRNEFCCDEHGLMDS